MLSQTKDFTSTLSVLSLILTITMGVGGWVPVYADDTSNDSSGLPGHRVGGGTRVSEF